MAIYFDKRNGLIVDKPHQTQKICPYCHINDGIKVECKFIEFNKFYCNRCDNTWKFGHNQQSKNLSIKQKDNEDSLFSIALRKTERKPTYDNSNNLARTSIKKTDRYQKSEIAKCPTCGALEHNLVQYCPVFWGIKSIRKAEKKVSEKLQQLHLSNLRLNYALTAKHKSKRKNYQSILLKNAKRLTGIEEIEQFVINRILLDQTTL